MEKARRQLDLIRLLKDSGLTIEQKQELDILNNDPDLKESKRYLIR